MTQRKATRSSPLQGVLARATLWLCARLPIRWAQALGAFLGWLAWMLPAAFRRSSVDNLARCFPELPAAERRRLARRSLIATGRTAAEAGALWGWPPERLAALEEEVVGGELLAAALASGRGTLLLLPHIGNWEVFNHFLMRRAPFLALYRPPRVAQLDGLVRRARQRTGCRMAPATRAGLKELYRWLDGGSLALILPDQEPLKRHGVFAPFFGVPALTMTLVGRLARRLRPNLLYGYAERRPDGRFRIHFRPAPEGLDDADPVVAAARLNRGVEECVRACPEQYTWSYKRFRTRPPDELSPPSSPASAGTSPRPPA